MSPARVNKFEKTYTSAVKQKIATMKISDTKTDFSKSVISQSPRVTFKASQITLKNKVIGSPYVSPIKKEKVISRIQTDKTNPKFNIN